MYGLSRTVIRRLLGLPRPEDTHSPARTVALHHAPAGAQLARDRQRPRELAERLLVVGRDEQQVLAVRARGARHEAQLADAREPVERLRRDVLGDAVDPDRPLGPLAP